MKNTPPRSGLTAILLLAGGFAPQLAAAGAATGTVNVIDTNSGWGGTFVQLNISTTFNYEPSCPNPTWAFIPSSDPQYTSHLALLFAAKASGETITITTSGCASTTLGQQPRIQTIDWGTRFPGT